MSIVLTRRRKRSLLAFVVASVLLLGCFLYHKQQKPLAQEEAFSSSRELFSLATRQCSLSMDTIWFRFNATSMLYEQVYNYSGEQQQQQQQHSDDMSEDDNVNDKSQSQDDQTAPAVEMEATSSTTGADKSNSSARNPSSFMDPGFQQRDGAMEEMRACWCTDAYFLRPMEYCPAKFDTCLVQGYTGPVSCYHTSGADSFVRSFWPVALIWILALAYSLYSSESGGSARDWVKRRCCACRRTQEEILEVHLQRLLERQPERAAFMYRHAVMRSRQQSERRRRRRGRSIWGRQLNEEEDDDDDDDESSEDENAIYRDVLMLKTKVFEEEASESQHGSSATLSSTPLSPRRNSEASTWLPPQFRREQVTLDEMDDEMEQGSRCAICLVRLENGDIVGDIPCGHMLHKDCLKDWLIRKNRCPLCQQPGIARLRPYVTLRHRRRNRNERHMEHSPV